MDYVINIRTALLEYIESNGLIINEDKLNELISEIGTEVDDCLDEKLNEIECRL